MLEFLIIFSIMFLPFIVGKFIFMFDFAGLKTYFTKKQKDNIDENIHT